MDLETGAFMVGFSSYVTEHKMDEEFCKKAYEALTSTEKTAGPLGNILGGAAKAIAPAAKAVGATAQRYGSGVANTMKSAPSFVQGVKNVGQVAGNKWLGHANTMANPAASTAQRVTSGAKTLAPVAGAAYGAGVAKDYSDMLNQNDEYNIPLSRKIMMGLGLEDKPSMLAPFNPFHKSYDKGVLDQLFGG